VVSRTAQEQGKGKHVVLLFDKAARYYYDYISYFYPDAEKEYGTSGGMHISRGYRHTVLNGASSTIARTLVHELAHNMVSDWPLPVWLNEGLAQFAEDMVPGHRPPIVDHRQIRLQHRYWSWFGMDHFWNGEGFNFKPSQSVSYKLAEILFRNLAGNRARCRSLGAFLATAHRKDAGLAACEQCFGCSPWDLVEEFLGPGNWKPKLSTANS
jgi:hypothetical protein